MEKKLYRKPQDKVIAGICSGLGEYLEIDPVIIRLVWLAMVLIGGSGVLVYLIAWALIPESPRGYYFDDKTKDETQNAPKKENRAFLGIILIVIGAVIGTNHFWNSGHLLYRLYHFSWEWLVPITLIAVGIFIVYNERNNS